jgi:hypothetical protein
MADDLIARAEKRLAAGGFDRRLADRYLIRDLAAEARALTAQLDTAHTVIRYLSRVADQGGPSNWRDFIAHPEVAAEIRAATADPTPQNDTDGGTDDD